jgi:iron complex transport system ATP-binding protein
MNSTREKVLSLDSLKIGYGSGKSLNILLPPINAYAYKGELIAVIGKNGIGKSTLLRTLAGLQPSLGGNVLIYGKDIKEFSKINLAHKIGYISTEVVRVSNMRVYDLVALGRFPHTNWTGKINSEDNDVIIDSIEKAGILKLCKRPVTELSDGERQRAMIARVLAQDTGILVMDEPTAFLDIRSKYEIVHLMHNLSEKRGKTIIFSTHDLNTAISHSDKIWLTLDDKLKDGAPEDLMIEGAFAHLFDDSSVRFNVEDGSFTFRSEHKGKIYVEGEGIKKQWTEKAINRAGYSVSEILENPIIKVNSGDLKKWQLITNKTSEEFSSIYELVNWLGTNKI